jgi:tetratricopeptide (TPR) repeat protein
MLVCCMSFLTIFSFALGPSTPPVVEQFYSTLEKIQNAVSDPSAYDYREIIKHCFRGKGASGINIPNDFYEWGYKINRSLTADQYANTLYELCYQKKSLRVEKCKIGDSQYISEVDLKQSVNLPSDLIQTVVMKTFTDGRVSKTFVDTLIVERNEIVVFKNAISTDYNEDIETLRVLAASYYTLKYYYKAYDAYEKIIKIDPDNGNAYYRLGLMTFWQQGCWYSTRDAHRKGLEYAEKSHSLGVEKAATAIYYMKHPRSL